MPRERAWDVVSTTIHNNSRAVRTKWNEKDMFPINKRKIHNILKQYNCDRSKNIESLYQSEKNINCHIFFSKRSHIHPHHYNSSATAYSRSSIVRLIKTLSFILNRILKPTKYRLLFKSKFWNLWRTIAEGILTNTIKHISNRRPQFLTRYSWPQKWIGRILTVSLAILWRKQYKREFYMNVTVYVTSTSPYTGPHNLLFNGHPEINYRGWTAEAWNWLPTVI